MKKEALRFEGVRVEDFRYGGLEDATFCLYEGETIALAGLMGSGKKSLMGILMGILPDYEGHIYVFGTERKLNSYSNINECKIASIGESPLMFDNISVLDNIYLQNRHRNMFSVVQRVIDDEKTKRLVDELNLNITGMPIEQLNSFETTKLEILKAFHGGARIIAFSSTFMYCSELEATELCRIIRLLNDFGVSVILESDNYFHIYKDVIERCVVVRNGIVTTTLYKNAEGNFDEGAVRHIIVGHAFGAEGGENKLPTEEAGDTFMQIADKTSGRSVNIHRGEIIGLYDPSDKLPRRADGLISMLNREYIVHINGKKLVARRVDDLVDKRIAVITKESSGDLIFNNLSPVENVCIYANHFFSGKLVYRKEISEYIFDAVVRRYSALKHCIGLKHKKHSYDLSYEQQYELMIAKWLALDPDVLVSYAPLSNHDMKNAERYRELQISLRKMGKVQILISSNYNYLQGSSTSIYEV